MATINKTTKVKNDVKVGFTNEIYKPILIGRTYCMLTSTNAPVTKVAGITRNRIKNAIDENKAIQGFIGKSGKLTYKLVEMDEFKKLSMVTEEQTANSVSE